jgi:hypothetical protein
MLGLPSVVRTRSVRTTDTAPFAYPASGAESAGAVSGCLELLDA